MSYTLTELREDVRAMGATTSYTPTITATTTNPTLGAGIASGYYTRVGKWVYGFAYIEFGAGMTAGSGAYIIGLPSTPSDEFASSMSSVMNIGQVHLNGSSNYMAFIRPNGTMFMPQPANASVSAGGPWTWISGYQLRAQFFYFED